MGSGPVAQPATREPHRGAEAITLVVTYILNAGINFVIGLIVASALGPSEFGRYALTTAVVTLLGSVLFEGLRYATTRFYTERVRTENPAIRATLGAGHAMLALILLSLAALVVLSGVEVDGFSSWLIAAMAASVLGLCLFEYHGALARARFKQWVYLRLTVVKNIAVLSLGVGAAFYFQSATMVLVALAASAMLGVIAVRSSLADPQAEWRLARLDLARHFLVYSAPLIAANSLYQLTILIDRTWLAAHYDLHEVGQFALAWDAGFRIFLVVGSALDTLLFQIAVRAEERGGQLEGEQRVASNVTLVFVLLLPAAAGFWVVLPAIEALIIPAEYHGSFVRYSAILVPAYLALCLIQYSLNPVFQLRKRTTPVVFAAVTAVGVNGIALLVLPHWYGAHSVALAQLLGVVAAFGVLVSMTLFGRGAIAVSWRDIGLAVVAAGVMISAVMPLAHIGHPLPRLIVTAAAGAAVYGGLAWLIDVASARALTRHFIHRLLAVGRSLRSAS